MRPRSAIPAILLWAAIALCCLAPLLWLAGQFLSTDVWRHARWNPQRWNLLARTLAANSAVAVLALTMALPAALVVGRGRGRWSRALLFLLPLSLVLPSIIYAYGWTQALRLTVGLPGNASVPDVLRCIWTLAAWMWGLPALVIGLCLRRLDSNLQLLALLDGTLWRTTARLLLAPIVASLALTTALAMQEFSVYEPTGIVVLATEIRTVFETGSGTGGNPANVFGAVGGIGRQADNQGYRAAAAIGTALPMLLLAGALAVTALLLLRGRAARPIEIEAGGFPACLEAGWKSKLATSLLLTITLGIPLAAMALSIAPERWGSDSQGNGPVMRVLLWAMPDVLGTLTYGALAGLAGLALALLAGLRRVPGVLPLAVAVFLIGGELHAIAAIRLFNQPGWLWQQIYQSPAIMVIAYIGRFGWIALLAGAVLHRDPWRQLREVAAVDGATPAQTLWHIIRPAAWPLVLAAALGMMVLAMGEVSATVLLAPIAPRHMILTMMTWVHMQRNDDMLEASLLLVGVVTLLAGVAAGLLALGARRGRRLLPLVALTAMLLAGGCDRGDHPQAIWLETGMATGQVVYPRGIAYSPRDNCFYVVDRSARIQRVEADGKVSAIWRMPDYAFGKPVGISVGPDGNVYVPDTHYARVIVFTPTGQEIRRWGSFGREPGQFMLPTDVAFDAAGNIYVAEYEENDRIQVFDPVSLAVLRIIGSSGNGPGQFVRPQSLVIREDRLYVADACNHRIAVLKLDGTWLTSFGSAGGGPGQFRFPYGLDMDASGRLVVCEFGNNRVQWIDAATGRSLRIWGEGGRQPGQLAYPWAVAVDRDGRAVVVDSGNNRLQVLGK